MKILLHLLPTWDLMSHDVGRCLTVSAVTICPQLRFQTEQGHQFVWLCIAGVFGNGLSAVACAFCAAIYCMQLVAQEVGVHE